MDGSSNGIPPFGSVFRRPNLALNKFIQHGAYSQHATITTIHWIALDGMVVPASGTLDGTYRPAGFLDIRVFMKMSARSHKTVGITDGYNIENLGNMLPFPSIRLWFCHR